MKRPAIVMVFLTSLILSACATVPNPTPTFYPTYTPYPTSTPYPIPTSIPADEAFVNALYDRLDKDDTIPQSGKEAVIALYANKPTFVFRNSRGIVLQFNVFEMPDNEPEIKKTAVLLIGTGVVVAGEHNVPLSGIEVVYYTADEEPWLALALAPPWDVAGDLRLAPLHPEYIKRLLEAGLITPTPEPTY
jgi:hypothetical protein